MNPLLSRRRLLGTLGAAAVLAPAVGSAQPTFTIDQVPITTKGVWRWLRAQLVLETGIAWLDTASFGPTTRAVLAHEYRQLEQQSLDNQAFANVDAVAIQRAALITAGQFFGTDPGDLVLTGGTRAGLGIVAAGLELQAGDEVLTTLHDHPSAVYPWLVQTQRRGVRVVQLPQDGIPPAPTAIVDRFASALTPRTKVMLFSHQQYTDGTVMPVQELCALARARGIFTIVDGAQAAGQLTPFTFAELGCDAYATCLHKWLNGPPGTGVLYLRRDTRSRLWPTQSDAPTGLDRIDRFGAPAVPNPDPAFAAQARFSGGCVHMAPRLAAIPLAFELHNAVGRARVAARSRELAAYFRDALARKTGIQILTPSHPALHAGIISVRVAGRDSAQLATDLALNERIVAGHVRHGASFDAVRLSLHPAVDFDELDRCATALQRRT